MELLVANQIIEPPLSIELVHKKIWIPHLTKDGKVPSHLPPMRVIFRLAGLDGEATEDRVEYLEDGDKTEKDPETKYKICQVFTKSFSDRNSHYNGVQLIL